jgi:hypothetical protein
MFYSHFTFPPRDLSFILMLLSHSLKVVEDPVCRCAPVTGLRVILLEFFVFIPLSGGLIRYVTLRLVVRSGDYINTQYIVKYIVNLTLFFS